MKRILALLFPAILVSPCFAATGTTLVMDGVVVDVANTIDNGPSFAVLISGGTGPCAGTWVAFPEAKAQSASAHRQAIALAMMALATGKKVRIHNYSDANCRGANFISVSNGASSPDVITNPN